MKIRPVGAELFHADGQTHGRTDMTKLIVGFRNFAKVTKKITSRVSDTGLIISMENRSISSRPSVLTNGQHTVSYCLHQPL